MAVHRTRSANCVMLDGTSPMRPVPVTLFVRRRGPRNSSHENRRLFRTRRDPRDRSRLLASEHGHPRFRHRAYDHIEHLGSRPRITRLLDIPVGRSWILAGTAVESLEVTTEKTPYRGF